MEETEREVVKVDCMEVLRRAGATSNLNEEQKAKRKKEYRLSLDELIQEYTEEIEKTYNSYKNQMPKFSPVLNAMYEKWDPIIAQYCEEISVAHEEYCKGCGY